MKYGLNAKKYNFKTELSILFFPDIFIEKDFSITSRALKTI